jgi:hypothetical protein
LYFSCCCCCSCACGCGGGFLAGRLLLLQFARFLCLLLLLLLPGLELRLLAWPPLLLL